jgi:signal transduction histidine kinase
MKTQPRQGQFQAVRIDVTNRRFETFAGPLTGFGLRRSNHRLLSSDRSGRSSWSFDPVFHLDRVGEALRASAVIEERNRMAREIHDTLVQDFAGILLHLEAANGADGAEKASQYVARARELAICGMEEARRMILGLRPKSLEGADLCEALGRLAERFSYESGIDCSFSAGGRAHKLSEEIENELYRVAQEALCNVRKHSRAGSVSIWMCYRAGAVELVIKDDGRGFALAPRREGTHGFGLPAMCERAHRLGGRMDVNSGPGTGTEVRMSVPLPAKNPRGKDNQ